MPLAEASAEALAESRQDTGGLLREHASRTYNIVISVWFHERSWGSSCGLPGKV